MVEMCTLESFKRLLVAHVVSLQDAGVFIFLVLKVYPELLVDEGLVLLVEQIVHQVNLHQRFAFLDAIDEAQKLFAKEKAL